VANRPQNVCVVPLPTLGIMLSGVVYLHLADAFILVTVCSCKEVMRSVNSVTFHTFGNLLPIFLSLKLKVQLNT